MANKEKWLFLGFEKTEKDYLVSFLKENGLDVDENDVLTGSNHNSDYNIDLRKSFTQWNKDFLIQTVFTLTKNDTIPQSIQTKIDADVAVIKPASGYMGRMGILALYEYPYRLDSEPEQHSILTLDINEPTFNAIVWENNIRVKFGSFKPGVMSKFHQILKKDGILFLPKAWNVDGHLAPRLFNYLGEQTLNFRGHNELHRQNRNTWHAFQKIDNETQQGNTEVFAEEGGGASKGGQNNFYYASKRSAGKGGRRTRKKRRRKKLRRRRKTKKRHQKKRKRRKRSRRKL